MKTLLINPCKSKVYGKLKAPFQIPMSLAYLGAVMEKNAYPVEIIDMDAEGFSLEDFTGRIKEGRPDLVGVTVTTPTLSVSLELAGIVKDILPGTKVVFGGIHPSIMPKETMSYDAVDFVVKGEGELTLLELLRALQDSGDVSSIDGLLFKAGGRIVENRDRSLIEDLDTLPFPARNLFKNNSYTYPDALYSSSAPMITSRGCPGRCTYCNVVSIFGRNFRARSAENVVNEIEFLVKEYHVKEIHICDDNFLTRKERVHKIRDEILRRRLKVKFAFPIGVRADFLDAKILGSLKQMGVYSIAIGVESGNQGVLDRAKKGIRLERIVEVFRMAKDFGLETWAFFIFGLPGETMNTAMDTIRFAKELDPDIAKFHILKPYPGTEVYRYLLDNNLMSNMDYDNFGIHTPPIHHLDGLVEEDLLRLQKEAYRQFYFRPVKLFKHLLRIKSVNRLKLNLGYAWSLTKMIFEKTK